MPTKSLQLWPGGRCVDLRWDDQGGSYQIKGREDSAYRDMTDDERRAVEVEERAEQIMETDVYCCDSSLVSELMELSASGEGPLGEEFSYEKVKNLRPDPANFTLTECKEWLDDNGHDLPDPNPWEEDRAGLIAMLGDEDEGDDHTDPRTDAELLAAVVDDMDAEGIDGLEAWRDAVRENAEDAEIYEWWRVSRWLADQLEGVGACVLDNAYGYWWGRTCTGQGMIMDGTLQRVAERLLR